MPTFTAVLLQMGNNVGIEVPEQVVLSFRAGKRVPVTVELNGFSYPSTIAPMAGMYLIPVSKEIRAQAGVAGGEEHLITVERDTSPRAPEVPDDLADALQVAGVRAAFDALAPSRSKEHVRSVNEARAAATRARRVQKVVESLRE